MAFTRGGGRCCVILPRLNLSEPLVPERPDLKSDFSDPELRPANGGITFVGARVETEDNLTSPPPTRASRPNEWTCQAALDAWIERYIELLANKQGLATALHSGDPAFDGLPEYFFGRLRPVLDTLIGAATVTGEIRTGTDPEELLRAIAQLCQPTSSHGAAYSRRMVALLIGGLRAR